MKIAVTTILAIMILASSDYLQAASPDTSDDKANSACQKCCPCPPATPGIPGLPGQPGPYGLKGDPGPKGQKGEIGRGEKGDTGEQGARGNPGPKGNIGVGLPGKMGPRGIPAGAAPVGEPGVKGQSGPSGPKGDVGPKGQKGDVGDQGARGYPGLKGNNGVGLPGRMGPRGSPGVVGPVGELGVKGQKGEPGETPVDSLNPRAFTVVRTTSTATSSSRTTRLTFQDATTLLPGTDIDLGTGTFTCNVPGVYVFMFSCRRYSGRSLYIHLYKNDDWILSGGSSSSNGRDQVSGSAVLTLRLGDRVYLTFSGRAMSGSPYRYTAFSGFLLSRNNQ